MAISQKEISAGDADRQKDSGALANLLIVEVPAISACGTRCGSFVPSGSNTNAPKHGRRRKRKVDTPAKSVLRTRCTALQIDDERDQVRAPRQHGAFYIRRW